MKKLLSLLFVTLIIGVATFMTSCDNNDDGDPTSPSVTPPSSTTNVQVDGTVSITFSISVPGGFKSASATATGGSASVATEPSAGSTSGDVVVDFTAGSTSGAASVALTVTDDNNNTGVNTAVLNITTNPPNEVISGNIDDDMTFTNDRIWELASKVFVTEGATLTIEPGTIIKGREGIGINATGLYIARDGMINAEGTADNPIIFTSVLDNIEVGQKNGTNLDASENGHWGGVVILGNAPISPDAGTEAQIEGVPASETLGLYGGDDPADNRGIFKYVSIRHGGTTIDPSAGDDINGLTLGGVGSGTEISHIEIFANVDDGVEFFGGSVNASNILIYTVGDDAIDVDQAYSGTIDNFMVYTSGVDAADSDEGLEIDGPEGAENAGGKFTIQNGSIISVDGGGSAADFKSSAQGTVNNVKWSGFEGGATIQIRASFDPDDACADDTDAYTNLINDELVFNTVEFGAVVVYEDDTDDACDIPGSHQTNAEGKVSSETATGASDATVFDGWTLSSISGLL